MKKFIPAKQIVLVMIIGLMALTGCSNQSVAARNPTVMNHNSQYTLIFNEAEWVMSVSPAIPSEYEFVQLTGEQISAVFYGLNISPRTAEVLFRSDGAFDSITAYDDFLQTLIGVGHLHGSNMTASYDYAL